MLLTVQNPYHQSHSKSKDSYRMISPFSNTISPYQTYEKELETNIRKLKERFPHREIIQLKLMLQELDNEFDIAAQLIQQQDSTTKATKLNQSTQSAILHVIQQQQAHTLSSNQASTLVANVPQTFSIESIFKQNIKLKRMFLKLHSKHEASLKELDEQEKTIHDGTTVISKLRTQNKLLLEQKFKQSIKGMNNMCIY